MKPTPPPPPLSPEALMLGSIIQFLLSALVILVAGAALTQFGDIIANKSRLGRLMVGTILIAGATSLPELGVNISSVRMGAADLAAGDLIGSSLFNLLILAVLDLTRRSAGRMFSEASANQAMTACVSIVLTAIVAIFILLADRMGSFEIWRVGPGTIVLLGAYVVGIRMIHRGRKRSGSEEQGEHAFWPASLERLELRGGIIGYLVAGACILTAAPFLAGAANTLAEASGLGGTFFGSTFVALCTSLPEAVTTFTALRIGAFSMAAGNILGSNCFNMVVLGLLDFVHPEALMAAVSPIHAYTAMCVIVVTCVLTLGQLYHAERTKPFVEPDAWLAILLIVASLTGLYFVK